tara:strand:+ start:37 stop:213 length:177 start_codon:yes stop_codon:yes gene_type:complete
LGKGHDESEGDKLYYDKGYNASIDVFERYAWRGNAFDVKKRNPIISVHQWLKNQQPNP